MYVFTSFVNPSTNRASLDLFARSASARVSFRPQINISCSSRFEASSRSAILSITFDPNPPNITNPVGTPGCSPSFALSAVGSANRGL